MAEIVTRNSKMLEIMGLKKETEIIADCLKKFSESITEHTQPEGFKITNVSVVTRDKKDYISFTFDSDEEILFKNLPAGYCRLFSIVLDIAYRAYILQLKGKHSNPIFTSNKPEDVNGIVVIDEIDLHLHPSLQQEVIQRFQRTFPNIQFIISTHSALVNLNNKLLQFNRKQVIETLCIILTKENWTGAKLKTKISEWKSFDQEHKLKEYCGIVIWYLNKKLKAQK